MGLLLKPDEIKKQTDSMIQALNNENESLMGILPTIENFTADSSLDGEAWKGLKSQLTGHQTIIRGLVAANDSMIADSEILASTVGNEELDEEKLKKEIERQQTLISSSESMISSYVNTQSQLSYSTNGGGTGNEGRKNYYSSLIRDLRETVQESKELIQSLEEKLETLYQIESSTSSLYTEGASLYASVAEGSTAIKNSWTGSGFSLSQGAPWQKNLDAHWTLSESNRTRELKQAGWDDKAIEAYNEYLDKKLEGLTGTEREKKLKKIHEDTYLVGSEIYELLFDSTGLSDRKKVNLLLKQMGASIDENNMLQLEGKYKFDPNMPPHAEFLEKFADCVKKAYPKGLIKNIYGDEVSTEQLRKIHQFRHYIDLHNLYYVRANFEGKTDYEKLLAYEKASNQKLSYSDSTQFHNRVQPKERSMGKEQINDKVKTSNGLSEFIVNVEDGSFVSQWDQLKDIDGNSLFIMENGKVTGLSDKKVNGDPKSYNLSSSTGKEIADTESFNYDAGGLDDWLPWVREHKNFDMAPGGDQKLDSDIRLSSKKEWPYPKPYKEKYKNPQDIK